MKIQKNASILEPLHSTFINAIFYLRIYKEEWNYTRTENEQISEKAKLLGRIIKRQKDARLDSLKDLDVVMEFKMESEISGLILQY